MKEVRTKLCLLPKISGVEVTPSLTSVESSEQFWRKIRQTWRICEPCPRHETLAIFYFQNSDIKPVSGHTYISYNVGVPACVKHLVRLTVCHVVETLHNGLCQPHSSHSQPMSWLNLLLLR